MNTLRSREEMRKGISWAATILLVLATAQLQATQALRRNSEENHGSGRNADSCSPHE